MEIQFLREVGFTDNETRVYLELLKSGEALASELSDRTGVNRTLAYQILNNLMKRGLASYVIKNNVKYFKAAHPSKLSHFLKEKELNIQKLIPDLLKLAKKPEEKKYSAELYEGKEGLKTIMNDITRSKPKEWLDFTSGLTIDVLPKFFMDKWEKLRVEEKIKARFLINDTSDGRKRGKELEKLKLSEVRYLPKGFKSPSHIYIYGSKVGIALWVKEFPFGILIESKEIAGRFREFFEWFWRLSKERV